MEPQEHAYDEGAEPAPQESEPGEEDATPEPRFSASRLELDALRAMLGLSLQVQRRQSRNDEAPGQDDPPPDGRL
jgi:hypothetical protein